MLSSLFNSFAEQATDGTLASENWALNMEICDMINESSDTARDAMKAIRKRLSQNAGKNYTVIMYTLTVLESCVKNCGKAFHVLVSNKEFIQELVKLIGPKNDPPAVVQEKVLNLIQTWADTFRSQPDLNGVVQVYQELKSKGIEFPVTDLDSVAPIYTPQRVRSEREKNMRMDKFFKSNDFLCLILQSVPEGVSASPPTGLSQSPRNHPEATHAAVMIGPNAVAAAGVVAGSVELKPERVNKIQSELDVVTMNMSILSEMLSTLKPGQEDPADYKLLVDLYHTCK